MNLRLLVIYFLGNLVSTARCLSCQDEPIKGMMFCNASRNIDERVEDLLPRLNISEKLGQLLMVASAVPRLGMSKYNFGGEALHGVWSTCLKDPDDGVAKCPTQFPAPITMSASFNRNLWEAMARASSIEARALYRANKEAYPNEDGFGDNCAKSLEGCLGLSFYTPNVNIARDPRWGRIEETPGEDPYVNSEYAASFMRGFQGNGTYLIASSVVKHFTAYNVEIDIEGVPPDKWCGSSLNLNGNCSLPNSRHSFNAHVSDLDLNETFLPPFRAAVRAGASAVMCSYNAVNGEPMCTNDRLLNKTLRGIFGFDGVVATDCGALSDANVNHRRYLTKEDTVTAAVRSGVDSNCGHYFSDALSSAMDPTSKNFTGLTEREIDVSVRRLLKMRFRLGLFDEKNGNANVPTFELSEVDSEAHRSLALKAAREGIILLQNVEETLPLNRSAFDTIAMIGPNANASMNMLSGYHGTPPLLVSPLEAVRRVWHDPSKVLYHVGCNVSGTGAHVNASIANAVDVANKSDVIVLGLGLCGDNYGGGPPVEDSTCFSIDESESIDRVSLALPGSQYILFRSVLTLGKPLVVFLMNAGPLDLSEIKASGISILSAGYGGEFGGQAIVDVLTGAYNPAGALTTTIYPQAYADMTSFHDMSMRAQSTTGNPAGRTYRFLNKSLVRPVFEFGFGLSYTTFELAFREKENTVEASLDLVVKNTGSLHSGDCVVACYVVTREEDSTRSEFAQKTLFDFIRMENLHPGASEMVSFRMPPASRAKGISSPILQCEVTGGVSIRRELRG